MFICSRYKYRKSMKSSECIRLEKDRMFKLAYMKKTPYWVNFLFVAPICFLFLGLVGILYLLEHGMLLSWYTIPFVLFFIFGTIWMKAVKRHLLKTKVDDPANFHVCIAVPVGEKEGYTYFLYANNDKRHNEYYISTIAEDFPLDVFTPLQLKQAKKQAVLMEDEGLDTDVYLKAFTKRDVIRKDAVRSYDDCLPVLAIDNKRVKIISRKEYN